MNRASIYYIDDPGLNTFSYDELLPPLPLPELHDTLERYYESLKPFGSETELANSREIIKRFEKGVGAKLHSNLKQRAGSMKNWLGDWWEKYAYHSLRIPLNPYTVMAMPMNLQSINIPEGSEYRLKNTARCLYYTIQFWDLIHKAKLKPLTSNEGKIKYSSALYKRFYSTTRLPGIEFDSIENHFKTETEGKTPTHGLILGKGRLFIFNSVHDDGSIITPQEILIMLQRLLAILDYAPMGDCVPILTHDDRTNWAKNRNRLLEISPSNKETLHLIESSNIVLAFDENEPADYTETSQFCVNGDYHSKWADRSSTIVAYKNGKFACIGEHSAYDGTVSVSYAMYVKLSLIEDPEPDWSLAETTKVVGLTELKLVLDEGLKSEISRLLKECERRKSDVIIMHSALDDYGKNYMKTCKLHPDSFVQVIMQLAYTRLHGEIAPTYETALMRHFHNGRTETLRSCTNEVRKFIDMYTNPNANKVDIAKAFRNAVEHHNHMMNEARQGRGVDRHIFGLWCTAYESKIDIPDFYDDPLYAKSGGGGNFVLSTSTLGYSAVVGFVAPMMLNGYGVFYSITSNVIFIQVTAYRDSTKTSAYKYCEMFKDTFRQIKALLDVQSSKL